MTKDSVRQLVWTRLDESGVAPGSAGYIPSFVGAEAAARRLTELRQWHAARVVKSNPDEAQLPVRIAALEAGKLVYMAVPRMATVEPFFELDPGRLPIGLPELATGRGADGVAPRVSPAQMRPVDLVVCGSVAVDHEGTRIGKGAGYSDLEVALLRDAGLIGPDTTIVTTVHDLQVVDNPIPAEAHDFHVHYIVTPTRTIKCPPSPLPRGVDWTLVGPDDEQRIPVLRLARRGYRD